MSANDCQDPRPCVCNHCTARTAHEHEEGDRACGRAWACQCGACRRARAEPPILALLEIRRGFARLDEKQRRLDAIRAIKKL